MMQTHSQKQNKKHSKQKSYDKPLWISLIAVTSGLISGLILMAITGHNPLNLFIALFRGTLGINLNNINNFFNARYIGEFIVTIMPVTMTGLSVAFAFRTGLFNIGAEGQLLMGSWGAIAASFMAISWPPVLALPFAIIVGMLAGGIWGFIPGILKAKFNIHEVVVTIMLNYAALYFTNFAYLLLPHTLTNVKTDAIPEEMTLHSNFLSSITNNSRLHWGIILLVIALIVYWVIMEKTSLGYELRATGFNKNAARYAGINVTRNIAASMTISGCFAGVAGVMISIGTFNYGRVLPSFEQFGFDGIAVALIGFNTAPGVMLAGMLFSALKSAQPIMQARGIPRDIITIIIAIVILMVAMQHGIRAVQNYFIERRKAGVNVMSTVDAEAEEESQ